MRWLMTASNQALQQLLYDYCGTVQNSSGVSSFALQQLLALLPLISML
jgi:hypothetical protein